MSENENEPIKLQPNEYLGDRISSLPNGRLDKRYTGVGATTVEIEDQSRHSIIICPTQSLAAGKAIKHNLFYYGGE